MIKGLCRPRLLILAHAALVPSFARAYSVCTMAHVRRPFPDTMLLSSSPLQSLSHSHTLSLSRFSPSLPLLFSLTAVQAGRPLKVVSTPPKGEHKASVIFLHGSGESQTPRKTLSMCPPKASNLAFP
jgi:hypothetical protein